MIERVPDHIRKRAQACCFRCGGDGTVVMQHRTHAGDAFQTVHCPSCPDIAAAIHFETEPLVEALRLWLEHETEIARSSNAERGRWNDAIWEAADPEGFVLVQQTRGALANYPEPEEASGE